MTQMNSASPLNIVFISATRLVIAAVSISRSIGEALVHLRVISAVFFVVIQSLKRILMALNVQ